MRHLDIRQQRFHRCRRQRRITECGDISGIKPRIDTLEIIRPPHGLFGLAPLLEIDQALGQTVIIDRPVRHQLDRLAQNRQGFFILAGQVQCVGVIVQYNYRQRIQLHGKPVLLEGFIDAPDCRQHAAIPLARGRVTRIEFDGPLEITLGPLPVVVPFVAQICPGDIGLGQIGIDAQRIIDRLLHFRKPVGFAAAMVTRHQHIGHSQHRIRLAIVGIEHDRLVEILFRLDEVRNGPAIPEKQSPQVVRVGLRVCRAFVTGAGLLLDRQSHFQRFDDGR